MAGGRRGGGDGDDGAGGVDWAGEDAVCGVRGVVGTGAGDEVVCCGEAFGCRGGIGWEGRGVGVGVDGGGAGCFVVDLVAGVAGCAAGGGAGGVEGCGGDGGGTGAGDCDEGVGDAELLGAGGGGCLVGKEGVSEDSGFGEAWMGRVLMRRGALTGGQEV